MSLEILHRDDDFVAIYKPAGLLVHRTSIDAGETRFCVQILRDQIGREVTPCHRLDKPASGALLFALNRPALKRAQAAFAAARTLKRYLAIVRGWIQEEGQIDYSLRYETDGYNGGGKGKIQHAKTNFRRLAKTELPFAVGKYPGSRYSLVELTPQTGRKHQLRRHLAHLRHPIVGDTRHGDGAHNRFFREHFACHRLLLVATELRFPEDSDMGGLHIRTLPDTDFRRVAEAAGLLAGPEKNVSP